MGGGGEQNVLCLDGLDLFRTPDATLRVLLLPLRNATLRRAGEGQGGEGKRDEERELHVDFFGGLVLSGLKGFVEVADKGCMNKLKMYYIILDRQKREKKMIDFELFVLGRAE